MGQALVTEAARYTYANGYPALDWTTDAGNDAARAMSKNRAAPGCFPRIYYRLAREDMAG